MSCGVNCRPSSTPDESFAAGLAGTRCPNTVYGPVVTKVRVTAVAMFALSSTERTRTVCELTPEA